MAQRLLRGAPGSTVKLVLLKPNGDPNDVTLVRERLFPCPSPSRSLDDGAGYVKVVEFGPKVGRTCGPRSRRCAGRAPGPWCSTCAARRLGRSTQAPKVAELFVKGGSLGTLKGEHTPEQPLSADPSQRVWELPLVVLVDNGTSGPGEIVAAALNEQAGEASWASTPSAAPACRSRFPSRRGACS